jgi:hypothetical protein
MPTRFREHVEVGVQTICLSVFQGLVMLTQPAGQHTCPDPHQSLRGMKMNQAEIVVQVELFKSMAEVLSILEIGKSVCGLA